ncbi:MAG: ATP-binding protein [Bacteroidota bacterium]|jgi:serine/threonine-protein kinase RsbW|nr:ATP-binding protein [Bacteroidota bacterium]|tara:strand:- start:7 stop:420 length:414 start_codon:yes stop_codon:yes gene_type:complete
MTTTLPELRFDSKPENIAVVEKLIDKISADHGIVAEHYGNVLIAMTEGVNNAIVHGNKLDESKSVSVSCAIDEKTLVFRITDEGPGFDYDNLPDPTAPENIEKPHGRGVFLMRHLADECAFEDEGRIVELTFTDVLA